MYFKAIISSFLITYFLGGVTCTSKGGNDHKWGYAGDRGPEHWKDHFPMCGGKRQSPIDIVTKDAMKDDKLGRITFSGYETKVKKAQILNNGHTVQLMDDDTEATISGGGLPATYKFLQLHFHWGKEDDRGSEHTFDGNDAPLEMHLVHVNKHYRSVEEALTKKDGLAVLAILFEVTDKDNEELEPIIEVLDDVIQEGEETTLEDDFDIDQLIPDDTLPYYRYEGSLTTPGCSESVIWTVFKHKQHISAKQLAQFRTLQESGDGDEDNQMEDNFRPPQPLNGRKVKVSIDTGDEDDPDEDDKPDGANQIMPPLLLIISIVVDVIRLIF
uniref:carbonic anhydrase n=1 Tax=Hadrurus spadix TaxID=141984 RepID=A0A1W7RAS9_9SCOR